MPSATIRVRLAGTATDATLYSDNAYTPLANPFTSEVDGIYQFYARDGRYDIVVTKTGYTFDNDDTADILLADGQSVISPAQITSNQNDYSPTNALNASTWRLNSDTARTITGIAAGFTQQRITLVNVGSFDISLSHQSTSSAAANRIVTPTALTMTLQASESVELLYDLTTARWRVVTDTTALDGTSPVVLDREAVAVTFNNTAALQSYYSFSVPANSLGTNRTLRVTAYAQLANTSGGNVRYDFRLYYGAAVMATATVGTTIATGLTHGAVVVGYVSADDATNAQTNLIQTHVADNTNVAANPQVVAVGTGAIDSTVAQNIEIRAVMDTASVNASITVRYVLLELL